MKVIGYGRESTADQSISAEVQQRQCREWFDRTFKDNPDAKFVRMLNDESVSGKTRLFQRPQGSLLLTMLERGDTVVASKMSRMFRSMPDTVNTLDVFNEAGIKVVLLDIGMDFDTPVGKLIFHILGAVNQFERELISERTKEALAQLRERGQYLGSPPPGWKFDSKRTNGIRELIPDMDRRTFGEYSLDQLVEGRSAKSIACEIEALLRREHIQRHGTNLKEKREKIAFSDTDVVRLAAFAVAGFPPINSTALKKVLGVNPFRVETLRQLAASA